MRSGAADRTSDVIVVAGGPGRCPPAAAVRAAELVRAAWPLPDGRTWVAVSDPDCRAGGLARGFPARPARHRQCLLGEAVAEGHDVGRQRLTWTVVTGGFARRYPARAARAADSARSA